MKRRGEGRYVSIWFWFFNGLFVGMVCFVEEGRETTLVNNGEMVGRGGG